MPLSPPRVTVYTCGPTVYDYSHIGHWFNYIRMDTLIRVLKLAGMQPLWVMNITDVGHLVSDADDGEDKLEKGARREGKTAWQVAEYYTNDFMECMQLLNITTPDHITKATDHIDEQIELIQILENKGFTYVTTDGVYFDTSKFENYAAFARLDLGGMQAGARVEYNIEKRNPTDFAVWKFSPNDSDHKRDMEWPSPWIRPDAIPLESQKGFPGWHIECSAMSMKYLGNTLDIHTGGIDHIPVHHTNEIAQSEAATGKRFANHWMHSNHVMFNGEKISKSLGNGIRLQTLINQEISSQAIRLHVLESHYRSQSQFSIDSLRAAQNRLRNICAFADLKFQTHPGVKTKNITDTIAETQSQIEAAIYDDLSTPEALKILAQLIDNIGSEMLHPNDVTTLSEFLIFLDRAFGLNLSIRSDISDIDKAVILERETARNEKNWKVSDILRDTLANKGIGIRDTPLGTIWFRI